MTEETNPQVVAATAETAAPVESTDTTAAVAAPDEGSADATSNTAEAPAPADEVPAAAVADAPVVEDLGTKDESSEVVKTELTSLPHDDTSFETGDINQVAPVPAQAPIATAIIPEETPAQPAEVSADTRELSEEEKYLENIRAKGTVEQQRMLAAIETFCEQMRPKSQIEAEKGVKFQHEFLKHLLWIIGKDYETFRAGWNVLSIYFSVYHGSNTAQSYSALSEFSTNRFLHAWTKGEDQSNAYKNLITLLRATRNKETRKHDIKTIDLAKVAPNVISEDGLSNLKKFYAV